MMKKVRDFEADITGLNLHGVAECRHQGSLFFVQGGVPEDRVRLQLLESRGHYGSAEIVDLIAPSRHRVNPRCESFEAGCGGCPWLNINYESQLKWKQRLIRETIKQKSRLTMSIPAVVGMTIAERYRNKLSLLRGEQGRFGFSRHFSREILPFVACRQELAINEQVAGHLVGMKIADGITQIHLRSTTQGTVGIHFYGREVTQAIASWAMRILERVPYVVGCGLLTRHGYHQLSGVPFLEQRLDDITYRIPHSSFFQINYEQARVLRKTVTRLVQPEVRDRILDLYCGVGYFSLDLARYVPEIVGIDNNGESIVAAKYNAKMNNIETCRFTHADVAAGCKKLERGRFTTIILDPPRAGCQPDVIRQLIRLQPRKIVYVSCDPLTFARDLRQLSSVGFTPRECLAIDLFPHTHHVEFVTCLERGGAESRTRVHVPPREEVPTETPVEKPRAAAPKRTSTAKDRQDRPQRPQNNTRGEVREQRPGGTAFKGPRQQSERRSGHKSERDRSATSGPRKSRNTGPASAQKRRKP